MIAVRIEDIDLKNAELRHAIQPVIYSLILKDLNEGSQARRGKGEMLEFGILACRRFVDPNQMHRRLFARIESCTGNSKGRSLPKRHSKNVLVPGDHVFKISRSDIDVI